MTPITIAVTNRFTGEQLTVHAWDVGIAGLAVQRTAIESGPAWIAAHMASGTHVGYGYTSPEAAVAAAWRLADLADWTADADTLRSTPGLADDVWAATEDGDVEPARTDPGRVAVAR